MALGDSIYIRLNQALVGYGNYHDVLNVTETTTIEAMIAAGYVTVVSGPATAVGWVAPSGSALASQRARQDSDRRGLYPLSAVTAVVSATQDATIGGAGGTIITNDVTGMTNNTSRLWTPTDEAHMPIEFGLPGAVHVLSRTTTNFGFKTARCSQTADGTVPGGTQWNLAYMTAPYRFRTNSPKVSLTFFTQVSGYNGYDVVVDGQPVAIRPKPDAGSLIDYLIITLDGIGMHDIEVRTGALFYSIGYVKNYDVEKPAASTAPTLVTLGDSYSQPIIWTDNGASVGVADEGLSQLMEKYVGFSDHYIDAISSTGFLRRSGSSYQAPNNSYSDRFPAQLARITACDVFQIPNGCINDISAGVSTQQQIATAIIAIMQAVRNKFPAAKIVYGDGFISPSLAASIPTAAAQAVAIRQLVQAQATAISAYYVATTGWLTGTGHIGATTGDGNADYYVGSDSTHLVGLGYWAMKRRWLTRLKRIVLDDGTLINATL